VLAERIVWFMERLGVPKGLGEVGYTSADIPALVEGALAQQRLTKLSPRAVDADALTGLFESAMRCW
jgi:hydroxyacid-oxoacid transhydrogenase